MAHPQLEQAAYRYEQAASELERAAHHLRITARHFREDDVPRGCAHAFAALGHMRTAQSAVDELAVLHASKSEL